jgi:two-component system response regulator
MKAQSMKILLVEDNEGDVELTRIAFKAGPFPSTLSVAHDGIEAMDYLSGKGKFQNVERPDLILLDLNMPKMDGKAFLNIVKQDAVLKAIPVVVLTSSGAPADVTECYDRHANCYILKPPDLQAFIEAARQVQNYWISLVKLPQSRHVY